jgi:hypothetical protein
VVDFEAVPQLTVSESEAIRRALARVGVQLESAGVPYDTAWRQAAVAEAIDDVAHASPADSPAYTPSPRSTRGATRA